MATTTVDTVTERTLVIDIFDTKTNKLVWRGRATATVSDEPKKNAKTIHKAAEKMSRTSFLQACPRFSDGVPHM